MDPKTLLHLELSLVKAEAAHRALLDRNSVEQVPIHWTDFLLSVARIYGKLEKGVVGDTRATAWFNELKRERRKDQLLRYLHFARNSDEHGLEFTTVNDGELTGFVDASGQEQVSIIQFQGKAEWSNVELFEDGKRIELTPRSTKSFWVLKRATDDRYNDFCDPPTEHLGIGYLMREPVSISEVALPYFRNIILVAQYFHERTL